MDVLPSPRVVEPLGQGSHLPKSADMKWPSLHLHCETLTDPMLVVLAPSGQAWQPSLPAKAPKSQTQSDGPLEAMSLVVCMAGQLAHAACPLAAAKEERGQ